MCVSKNNTCPRPSSCPTTPSPAKLHQPPGPTAGSRSERSGVAEPQVIRALDREGGVNGQVLAPGEGEMQRPCPGSAWKHGCRHGHSPFSGQKELLTPDQDPVPGAPGAELAQRPGPKSLGRSYARKHHTGLPGPGTRWHQPPPPFFFCRLWCHVPAEEDAQRVSVRFTGVPLGVALPPANQSDAAQRREPRVSLNLLRVPP